MVNSSLLPGTSQSSLRPIGGFVSAWLPSFSGPSILEIATMFTHEWADFPHDWTRSQAPILRMIYSGKRRFLSLWVLIYQNQSLHWRFTTFKYLPFKPKPMANNKVSMPSSMGGLVRYFDEYKSKVQLKPGHVIVLIILIMLIEILLHWQGKSLLGI